MRDVPLAYLRHAAAGVAVMSSTDTPDRAAGPSAQIAELALERGKARRQGPELVAVEWLRDRAQDQCFVVQRCRAR